MPGRANICSGDAGIPKLLDGSEVGRADQIVVCNRVRRVRQVIHAREIDILHRQIRVVSVEIAAVVASAVVAIGTGFAALVAKQRAVPKVELAARQEAHDEQNSCLHASP
jgi:hypothetical protein